MDIDTMQCSETSFPNVNLIILLVGNSVNDESFLVEKNEGRDSSLDSINGCYSLDASELLLDST